MLLSSLVLASAAHLTDGAGERGLCRLIFQKTFTRKLLLACTLGLPPGTVGFGVLRALRRVDKQQNVACFDFEQTGIDEEFVPYAVGVDERSPAGRNGTDEVAVVREKTTQPVRRRYGEIDTFASVKYAVRGENFKVESIHTVVPLRSFSVRSRTSSIVPALKKADSGQSSILPERIARKPRSVSCRGT